MLVYEGQIRKQPGKEDAPGMATYERITIVTHPSHCHTRWIAATKGVVASKKHKQTIKKSEGPVPSASTYPYMLCPMISAMQVKNVVKNITIPRYG